VVPNRASVLLSASERETWVSRIAIILERVQHGEQILFAGHEADVSLTMDRGRRPAAGQKFDCTGMAVFQEGADRLHAHLLACDCRGEKLHALAVVKFARTDAIRYRGLCWAGGGSQPGGRRRLWHVRGRAGEPSRLTITTSIFRFTTKKVTCEGAIEGRSTVR